MSQSNQKTQQIPSHCSLSPSLSLSTGPCGIITAASTNKTAFLTLHEDCIKNNQAAHVATLRLSPETLQLAGTAAYQGPFLLCPLSTSSEQTGAAAFAIFPTSTQAADITLNVIKTRQLPLIFDLDETLIVGRTPRTLANDIARAKKDLGRNREDRSKNIQLQLLEKDLAMLQSFSMTRKVTLPDGSVVEGTNETAVDESGKEIERLVLRLPGDDLRMFVRIKENNRDSDMIFRFRPRWNEVRAYLTGSDSQNQQKSRQPYFCYVCTTALRDYAHEAWRDLDLDPHGPLIPVKERSSRVFARVGTELQKPKRLETIFDGVKPAPKGMSCVPLAVIIDDRVDVWGGPLPTADFLKKGIESVDYVQVMQVMPFAPWEEEANSRLGEGGLTLEQVSAEMARVKKSLIDIHKSIFAYTDNLKAKYNSTLGAGVTIDLGKWHGHYSRLFGEPLTVERALEGWRNEGGKPPNVPFYWGPWAPPDSKQQPLPAEIAKFWKSQPQRLESWEQHQYQHLRPHGSGDILPQDKHGYYGGSTSKAVLPQVGVAQKEQQQGNDKSFNRSAVQGQQRERKAPYSPLAQPPPPPEEQPKPPVPTEEEKRVEAEIKREFAMVLKIILEKERRIIDSRSKTPAADAPPQQTGPPPMFSRATKHKPRQQTGHPRKRYGKDHMRAQEDTTPYLWITNLKADITDKLLGENLSRFNNIENASKKVGKTFGYLEFSHLLDAQMAKSKLNGKCVADLSGTEKLGITLGHSAPVPGKKTAHQGTLEPGAPDSKRPRFS